MYLYAGRDGPMADLDDPKHFRHIPNLIVEEY